MYRYPSSSTYLYLAARQRAFEREIKGQAPDDLETDYALNGVLIDLITRKMGWLSGADTGALHATLYAELLLLRAERLRLTARFKLRGRSLPGVSYVVT